MIKHSQIHFRLYGTTQHKRGTIDHQWSNVSFDIFSMYTAYINLPLYPFVRHWGLPTLQKRKVNQKQFRLHAAMLKVQKHEKGSQGITSAWLTTAGNTHRIFIPVQHSDRSDTSCRPFKTMRQNHDNHRLTLSYLYLEEKLHICCKLRLSCKRQQHLAVMYRVRWLS